MPDSPPPPPHAAADIQPFPAPPEERDPSDGSLVPVRTRHDGWTPEKQRAFIEHLADQGCVTSACAAVGMSESSAYRLRRRPGASAFDAAWADALGFTVDRVAARVVDRAINGDVRKRWHKGEVVGEERVFSDRLQTWVLRYGRAALARSESRHERIESFHGTVAKLGASAGGAQHRYQVWRNEFGHWRTNAPPPPDCEDPGDLPREHPGYSRYLTLDEEEAWEARPGNAGQDEAAEAARQALFAPPEA